MEVMLAFITDDFFQSDWTNQEIGVALGRGIPIIPLKLGKTDPKGFISGIQALPGFIESPKDAVEGIYKVLADKLKQEDRLKKATIQAFVTSNNFDETRDRFDRLKTLRSVTEADIQQIIDGFANNDQLHKAIYLRNDRNRLTAFLENRTGKKYQIVNNVITLTANEMELDDTIPF